jgi:3-hydroxybutyryl-CoA dehydrogenase
MMIDTIKTIAVAGAGAMGAGIAQVFAQAGYEVRLFDLSQAQLDKAKADIAANLSGAVAKGKLTEQAKTDTIVKIQYTTDVNTLKAELVVEAIIEKIEVKKELFLKLAEINPQTTILASNTSSLPITRIAAGIPNPGRVVGMHFFNPAHLMKLVEIISGAETSPEVTETMKALVVKIGKTLVVAKDSPGFIVNRVARHYYVESLRMLEERVAPIETIDALMESAGFRMGPFTLMDTVGNDINFAVTSSLYNSFHQEAKFRPSRIQENKVDAGHFGKKSGKGFYNYS